MWLSPNYEVFKDDVLVYTPNKNYTAKDMVELYKDANAQVSAEIMNDIEKFRGLTAPGVVTNCIMGNGWECVCVYLKGII
jgi:hypothetical protein